MKYVQIGKNEEKEVMKQLFDEAIELMWISYQNCISYGDYNFKLEEKSKEDFSNMLRGRFNPDKEYVRRQGLYLDENGDLFILESSDKRDHRGDRLAYLFTKGDSNALELGFLDKGDKIYPLGGEFESSGSNKTMKRIITAGNISFRGDEDGFEEQGGYSLILPILTLGKNFDVHLGNTTLVEGHKVYFDHERAFSDKSLSLNELDYFVLRIGALCMDVACFFPKESVSISGLKEYVRKYFRSSDENFSKEPSLKKEELESIIGHWKKNQMLRHFHRAMYPINEDQLKQQIKKIEEMKSLSPLVETERDVKIAEDLSDVFCLRRDQLSSDIETYLQIMNPS